MKLNRDGHAAGMPEAPPGLDEAWSGGRRVRPDPAACPRRPSAPHASHAPPRPPGLPTAHERERPLAGGVRPAAAGPRAGAHPGSAQLAVAVLVLLAAAAGA